MKKIALLGSIALLSLSLCACGNKGNKQPSDSSDTQETHEQESTQGTQDSSNEYGEFDTPVITGPVQNKGYATKHFDNNLKKDGPLTQEAFPSLGSPRLLVLPVSFDTTREDKTTLDKINTAFNGTSEETGWESLKSFYDKSSYGKLTIESTVEESWFRPAHDASYYEGEAYGTDIILSEALTYYDDKYDYRDYDYDNDGYIDSVWLIYNHDVEYEKENSMWWAFTTWSDDESLYDNEYVYYYAFAGIDFMEKNELNSYDDSNINIDAHTYIHETGHLLGLDDYYDYADKVGATGGLYAADMMDYNIGDHGMISKMLLGWVDPTVVVADSTIELASFTTSGQFLLIADHKIESIYDEYFLVEFYTNDGLNANDLPIGIDGDIPALGIRIIHIDAHKNIVNGECELNGDEYYGTGFLYDNSGTDKLFANMIRADYGQDMETYLFPESLYTPTSLVFGETSAVNYKYHTGASLNFSLKVNEMNESKASVTISFK